MIQIKNKDQISMIQKSGKIAAFTLKHLLKCVKSGVKTSELEKIAKRLILARGATPSFLGYRGYKFATCISINDEVVHGLPSERKIANGDVVSIDIGVNYKDYYSDTAATVAVLPIKKDTLKLIEGTKKALEEAIGIIRPGIRIGEIENASGEVLKKNGLSAVLALSGHGVGFAVHEEPSIRTDGQKMTGEKIRAGMVFAIEPMATLGSGEVTTDSDGWTVRTIDSSCAAHFEHTVAVTKDGVKLLTGRL